MRKLRERGDRTQQSVADELNISLAMLKGWLRANVIAMASVMKLCTPGAVRRACTPTNYKLGETPSARQLNR